jgi:hypothetical protein
MKMSMKPTPTTLRTPTTKITAKKFFNMNIRTMKIKYIIIACAFALPLFAQAQEQLIGLHGNPVIERFLKSNPDAEMKLKSQQTTTDAPLWLPFFDDFTNEGPYPDPLRWEDNFAFINTSFQKNPVNRGVATLDALNADGKLYPNASPYPFMADYLTSRPIRTDSIEFNEGIRSLTPDDSLYLSFYYQPQGMGDAPNRYDSLALEFFVEYADTTIMVDSIYHPADTLWINDLDYDVIDEYYEYRIDTLIIPDKWQHIWASQGMSIDTFYAQNKQWMAQVMIPLTDIEHFRPDFRFRFRNYASLPNNTLPSWQSNMDQWNIDYVYFNLNRTAADTTYRDVSFVNPGESFLQDFTAMPYKQYAAAPSVKRSFKTTYTNLDNVSQNIEYKYRIYAPNGGMVGTDENYQSIEFWEPILPGVRELGVNVPVMFSLEQGVFSIQQTLTGDIELNHRLCDTITYLQELGNYFAYDDGTPEAGYGLTPAQAIMAVLFPTNTADTLQAVDIFFNTTPARQTAGQLEYFKLMVWYNNHGEPDTAIYVSDEILYGNEAGKFIRFPMKSHVLIPSSGFFVGIQQSTADNMNVGFDYSNDMHSRNMFKIYNDWQTSNYPGSIMIRPVMGTSADIAPPYETPNAKSIVVFPNPLTSEQQIYIQKPESFTDEHEITLKIYDGIGRQCYQSPYTKPEITLNSLYNGIFIITLHNHTTGETATTKLMITR